MEYITQRAKSNELEKKKRKTKESEVRKRNCHVMTLVQFIKNRCHSYDVQVFFYS